jgi:hypothetical protein
LDAVPNQANGLRGGTAGDNMKHHPVYVEIMRRLLPLLRQYKPFAGMPFALLCDHLAWFWNRGTMSYVIDSGGKPHAVCLIKLFHRLEYFLWPYIHYPCGKFVMIELMVADEPNAMAHCFNELTQRFGPQEVVVWDRQERTENGCPRMYRWSDFIKLSRRLTYGAVEYV